MFSTLGFFVLACSGEITLGVRKSKFHPPYRFSCCTLKCYQARPAKFRHENSAQRTGKTGTQQVQVGFPVFLRLFFFVFLIAVVIECSDKQTSGESRTRPLKCCLEIGFLHLRTLRPLIRATQNMKTVPISDSDLSCHVSLVLVLIS